jgi:hypothetical protein
LFFNFIFCQNSIKATREHDKIRVEGFPLLNLHAEFADLTPDSSNSSIVRTASVQSLDANNYVGLPVAVADCANDTRADALDVNSEILQPL